MDSSRAAGINSGSVFSAAKRLASGSLTVWLGRLGEGPRLQPGLTAFTYGHPRPGTVGIARRARGFLRTFNFQHPSDKCVFLSTQVPLFLLFQCSGCDGGRGTSCTPGSVLVPGGAGPGLTQMEGSRAKASSRLRLCVPALGQRLPSWVRAEPLTPTHCVSSLPHHRRVWHGGVQG